MRKDFPIIVIQEAGLDGFWIHRVLEQQGMESHIVDPASIMTSRRRRRAGSPHAETSPSTPCVESPS